MADAVSQMNATINGLTREFDVITNNLANVSTVGYKRTSNAFSQSLLAQSEGTGEAGGEAELLSVYDFSQGSFIETGRSLDFALCGKGLFVIETPEGPLYTRNGMFRLNKNGQVVDSSGRIVAGQSGPITIPPEVGLDKITVSSDGNISGNGVVIDKFKLVEFGENENKLVSAGFNCFQAPADIKPDATKNLIVKQGFQEGSNVQMVEELVDMITVSRLYEANMRLMSAGKDTTKSLLNVAMS
jgi:flagellar basal body rod protein FlgG